MKGALEQSKKGNFRNFENIENFWNTKNGGKRTSGATFVLGGKAEGLPNKSSGLCNSNGATHQQNTRLFNFNF